MGVPWHGRTGVRRGPARRRPAKGAWLPGLLAALLAVATMLAPLLHAGMAWDLRGHESHHAHHETAERGEAKGFAGHGAGPASCFACLLVAAPGLPDAAGAGARRIGRRTPAWRAPHRPGFGRRGWPAQHARAPPRFP